MNQIKQPHINSGNIERRESVYEYLFNTYYVGLCSYAIRYVERKDLAEEIVSETFFKMWQRGTIELTGSIKSYLFQAVYNNCMYFLRQQSSERKRITNIQQQFESNNTYRLLEDFTERDSLILKELEEMIHEAIKRLPEQAQKVFALKRYKGLKNKEVADQLNISVKTVEMHMTRALLFLKTELKDYIPTFLLFFLLGK